MDEQRIVERFKREGFVVVPALFAAEEVAVIKNHFMALNAAGHGFDGDNPSLLPADDPLRAYPRIIHSHRWDKLSLNWLLDERLRQRTTALLSREPLAAQTMFYFKPPSARGQALHQDQTPLYSQQTNQTADALGLFGKTLLA
ncbi:MAG: phytanoyl-CoA dioxygenase family protein [Chloroflexi bacterium]|nr:phytanoyl-CoA dioxygenase family protein [Chloroflexota bacterium]